MKFLVGKSVSSKSKPISFLFPTFVLMSNVLQNIISYFNLDTELENHDVIHQEIQKGVIFKGTNLWILVFAIGIASVGLNMNSTAVIIGAMLISPLMGPINGMGYSIATYDFELFRTSIKNFSFAVLASLVTSTLYFSISPISTAHSELLARTSPTIYDVLIALLGGLAGIFAISSKMKGNVIPGVAIATALMPPLCTAGYGLATGQFTYFLGAFYLFTINTVFIALASVVVSQVLRFPIRAAIEPKRKSAINRYITFVILLVLLPSVYFGFALVQKERFQENAKRYVASVQTLKGLYLLSHEINLEERTIRLIYGGAEIDEVTREMIVERAPHFRLTGVKIDVRNRLQFSSNNGLNMDDLLSENRNLKSLLIEKEKEIKQVTMDKSTGNQIVKEALALFNFLDYIIIANGQEFGTNESNFRKMIVVKLNDKPTNDEDKSHFEKWMKVRLNDQKLMIVYEKQGV